MEIEKLKDPKKPDLKTAIIDMLYATDTLKNKAFVVYTPDIYYTHFVSAYHVLEYPTSDMEAYLELVYKRFVEYWKEKGHIAFIIGAREIFSVMKGESKEFPEGWATDLLGNKDKLALENFNRYYQMSKKKGKSKWK